MLQGWLAIGSRISFRVRITYPQHNIEPMISPKFILATTGEMPVISYPTQHIPIYPCLWTRLTRVWHAWFE